ncbi:hypothetical protein CEXT_604161 [Caerostris extrusa]|uniref:Uncharacterized protein n=1 Tax=Caerostris extrusa TaxID=172846 RepID=A0AAV4TS01_CAEEX|nr:hypothetical protein CEXT_604161 [Caerostris extrusa]
MVFLYLMANDFSCPSRALGEGGRGAPRIEPVPGGQMKTRDQHPQLERKVKTSNGVRMVRESTTNSTFEVMISTLNGTFTIIVNAFNGAYMAMVSTTNGVRKVNGTYD